MEERKLVIVESPTKAKTLSGILDKSFSIKASMGHIRDLPKSGMGVDIEHNFKPEYTVPDKSKKVLDDLKKGLKETQEVILATDPDREGEAIAWHLKELLKPSRTSKSTVNFGRVVFHELTKSAIEEAFSKVGDINMDLVNAQQARRVLDRLVGYKLSPLLWKKVRYGLSAGRVQSVAVRLIVEKERERQAFKSEEYWTIKGEFEGEKDSKRLVTELEEKNNKKVKIRGGRDAEKIQNELKDDSFVISEAKKTERNKNPYPPFKTSSLQQSMANAFGFGAKRTMSAAQQLFEKGYITYHRTDSLNLSGSFISNVRGFILDKFGKSYLPEKPFFYKTKTKNAQEAHEAIRVTDLTRFGSKKIGLTGDQLKVYSMVWLRSVECQMVAATYDQTSISVKSDKGYVFKASGSVVKFDGWLAAASLAGIKEEDEEMYALLEFSEGEKVLLVSLTPEQHFTQPPARYSDATLIKKMEEIGVGRPSTYAPTIATIESRGYVERDGRYFVPTDVAFVVNDLLVEHFSEVVDYKFTAQIEEELDDIADGEKKWVPVVREFYEPFEKGLVEKERLLNKTEITTLGQSDEKCPECGRPLIYKLGKYGKFLSCSGYPDCTFAKPAEKETIESLTGNTDEETDFGKCDKCGEGTIILREGRFGKFLACSNYPKCKNTKPYLQKLGMKCPKCSEGEVIVKKARRRKFYGCSRYPDCDWSSWKNPLLPARQEEEKELEV